MLAANQGPCTGFLAAGLLWFLYAGQWNVVLFFLGCVLVAAIAAIAAITAICVLS